MWRVILLIEMQHIVDLNKSDLNILSKYFLIYNFWGV